MVGLAGAQAVQGLAAPWVPVGGREVDCHLVEMGRGYAASMRATKEARPELASAGRTKVNQSKPPGSLVLESGEGNKLTTPRLMRGPSKGSVDSGLLCSLGLALPPRLRPRPQAFTVNLIWQPPMM